MSYRTILTDAGLAAEATAHASGAAIKITHFAVGDGAGAAYTPVSSQTGLKRETYRAAVNAIYTDTNNPSYLIVECVVPASVGGWYVREAAVILDTGTVWGIANYPDTYKPALSDGAGKDLYLRLIFEVSNAEDVTLSIDPAVVLSSRQYAETVAQVAIASHESDGTHEDASETRKGFTRLATVAETLAGASKDLAVHPAGLKAAIDELVAGAPGALDTLKELSTALGNDSNFSASVANALALKAPLASPSFTGFPKAPTLLTSDSSDGLATSKLVDQKIAQYRSSIEKVVVIDASVLSFQCDASHWGAYLLCAYGRTQTLTITLPPPADGKVITIKNDGAEVKLLPGAGGGYIEGSDAIPATAERRFVSVGSSYRASGIGYFDIPFLAGWGAEMTGEDLSLRQYGAVMASRDFLVLPGHYWAFCDVPPTGADIVLDVRVNGTSIFSTLPKIVAGSYNITFGVLKSSPCIVKNIDRITFHVVQTGSVIKGQRLYFYMRGLT